MAEYRNQHYLPAAYLGQFGSPLTEKSRERIIWRIDKCDSRKVTVESQCRKKWFYSKDRAAICEKYFQQIESVYAGIMKKVHADEQLNQNDLFVIFICAIDFVARSYKYQASAGSDKFGHYLKRMETFKHLLIFRKLKDQPDEVIREYILRRWEFSVAQFSRDKALLTSDFPTIMLGHSLWPNELKGVVLPLTPTHCFLGVSSDCYKLTGAIPSDADSSRLNIEQVENSLSSIYFRDELPSHQIVTISVKMNDNPRISEVDHGWELDLIDFDQNPSLSLIQCR